MARNTRKPRGKSNESGERAGDFRRSRTIRFSDSEWQLVEDAALRQGIPASQLVRAATLAAAEERLDRPAGTALTPGHIALIEDIYRGVYLLTTLRQEELLGEKRKKQLDSILNDGRLAMADALGEGPA
ncbi:MAG: hypothetical protein F4092_14200 [Rhodospirillaceae bacterium]|nr:hypothetical protein [Rhodospirillaceae bacterium]MYJ72887.1 hypothetical protein [Rhodospirillaceae bacterium]